MIISMRVKTLFHNRQHIIPTSLFDFEQIFCFASFFCWGVRHSDSVKHWKENVTVHDEWSSLPFHLYGDNGLFHEMLHYYLLAVHRPQRSNKLSATIIIKNLIKNLYPLKWVPINTNTSATFKGPFWIQVKWVIVWKIFT